MYLEFKRTHVYNSCMDKRETKTRKSLYEAFKECLKTKDYNSISISDLLSKSGVSRSTFYSHFKSKDDVLKALCNEIFDHVFAPTQTKESDHDFSNSSTFDYTRMITHVFYHFYDKQELIREILVCGGAPIFLETLKERTYPLFSACIKSRIYYKEGISEEIQIHQISESFVSLIRYYVENGCKLSPEELMEIFNKLYQ